MFPWKHTCAKRGKATLQWGWGRLCSERVRRSTYQTCYTQVLLRSFSGHISTHPVVKIQVQVGNRTEWVRAAVKDEYDLLMAPPLILCHLSWDWYALFEVSCFVQSLVERGFMANDWIKAVATVMGGKGGGSKTSAQASGTSTDKVAEVLQLAREFAKCKLDS